MNQYILMHTAQYDPSVEAEETLKSLLEAHHFQVLSQLPGIFLVQGKGDVLQPLVKSQPHWQCCPATHAGFLSLN